VSTATEPAAQKLVTEQALDLMAAKELLQKSSNAQSQARRRDHADQRLWAELAQIVRDYIDNIISFHHRIKHDASKG